MDSRDLALSIVDLEQGNRRALQRPRGAAVEEAPRARQALDDVFGAQGPGQTPARIAPALGQTVDDDDGIFVHVLDIIRRRRRGDLPLPDIVAVELIEDESAVHPPGDLDPAVEHLAANDLARRIA